MYVCRCSGTIYVIHITYYWLLMFIAFVLCIFIRKVKTGILEYNIHKSLWKVNELITVKIVDLVAN